jgi:phosphoglycerate dehydrogenase-like enzyme
VPSEERFVVFIPEPFPEASLRVLDSRFEVRQGRAGQAYTEDQLVALLADVDAVAVNSRDPLSAHVIASSPRLKVIAKAGSKPTSNVDLVAAGRCGVRVTWTPGANTVSVAEMTLALILTVVKRLPELNAHLRRGGWRTYDLLGAELAGKTLGLVGLGAVGREVGRLFQAFGGQVTALDPGVDTATAAGLGIRLLDLPGLLASADILSLHCEMNPGTAGMINVTALAKMKAGAVLVNTARGGLVDEEALLSALDSGRLSAAALDVFAREPVPMEHPILTHPRVFAVPHVSAFTHEASLRETSWALEDAARVLSGLEPRHLRP